MLISSSTEKERLAVQRNMGSNLSSTSYSIESTYCLLRHHTYLSADTGGVEYTREARCKRLTMEAITMGSVDKTEETPCPILSVTATGDFNPPLAPFRERISWALYDFANTVFSMNIATLYFAAWLVADLGHSNTLYAIVNGIASALVVISIPIFGAISDATQRRKPWVVGFTLIACVSTIVMAILGQTGLPLIGEGVTGAGFRHLIPPGIALFGVLAAFTIANYAYQGAQPFYNAMMPELVPVDHRGRLSGMGAALGYVGSIIGVLLTFPFFTGEMPILGTIPDRVLGFLRSAVPFTMHGGRVSTFVPTAILFLLFSLPLFLFCRDHNVIHGKRH